MSVIETEVRTGLSPHVVGAEDSSKGETSERVVVWGLWIAWLLACLPLLFIHNLPAVDYPDHLARIYVLAHGMDLPGYAQFYHPNWAFLPNLAFDMVMVPLAKILPITLAGRVFLFLVFGLTIYGGARLNRALLGTWSWLALLPALLIYNRILAYGFINFLFGLGLLLLALALHVEQRKSAPGKRIAIESVFMVGLFASHLVSLALYVFCALVYDFSAWLAERPGKRAVLKDIAVILGPFFILMAIFVFASPTTGEASRAEFRPFLLKMRLLHLTVQTGQGIWDTVFGALIVLFFGWLLLAKKARFAPRMVIPLIGLCVVFLLCPTGFKQAMNVDTRIPLVLTLVAFAALVPAAAYNNKVVGGVLMGLLAFRAASTTIHYREWNGRANSVMADLRKVPAGSILLVTRNKDSHAFDAVAWDPALMHMGCLLLLERPIMADDLFTIPTQQPLLKNKPYDDINLTAKVGGTRARDMQDYGREAAAEAIKFGLEKQPIFIYYVKEPGPIKLPPELTTIADRRGYAIYRVNPTLLESDKNYTLPTAEIRDDHIAGEVERWNTSN
jgi:hypothetical protein